MKRILVIPLVLLLASCAGITDLTRTGSDTGLGSDPFATGGSFTAAQANAINNAINDNDSRLDDIEEIVGPVISDGDGTYSSPTDGINDIHLDWGSDVNQIDAADLPVDASGFTGILSGTDTDVATALATLDAGGNVPADDSVTMAKIDDDGDFTSLTGDWATTGTMTGAIKIDSDSDGYSVTGAMLYGGLLVQSGNQQTVTLAAVAAGMHFCVVADGADGSAEVYVDCDASDHFEYDGTTMADGEYIYNDSDTKGDRMCFTGLDASTWFVTYGGDTTVAEETP